MNNQQFRRLLLSDANQKNGSTGGTGNAPAATPKTVLGARKHSSIPMTPRQVGRGSVQADFARQLAERNAKANPDKKPRSSAPKGTKLAAGYTDRSKDRHDDQDSETAKRIKNLEEAMKLGQIDRATFENLVLDITGGDIGKTHLVKGLDRRLLERVRRGEDVSAGTEKTEELQQEEEQEDTPEVDDAFDDLAGEDIGPVQREKKEKKGEKMSMQPPPVAGVKRSRNDILKHLKRQREEATAAAAAEHEKKFPTLGAGFRKVTAQGETTRIEVDDKGREVLIITSADGKEKRKVRKQKSEPQAEPEVRHDLDDATKPINMHNLPHTQPEDSDDDDIFEGMGSNYNPLAGMDNDEDSSEDEEGGQTEPIGEKAQKPSQSDHGAAEKADRQAPTTASTKRDYFKQTSMSSTTPSNDISSADATVRAALLKVRNLGDDSTLLQNLSSQDPNDADTKEARLKKRAAELAMADRDMDDMDLGFGASRFDDAEDMEKEGEKIKLSKWKGLNAGEDEDDDDDDDAEDKGNKKQRKRGPKKRQGDKNKAEDVLKVMERQKEKKTLG